MVHETGKPTKTLQGEITLALLDFCAKQNPKFDAERFTRALLEAPAPTLPPTVYVHVEGGAVSIGKPKGVAVEVVDFDTDGAEAGRSFNMKTIQTHTPGPWIDEAGSQRRAGQRDSVDRFVIGTPKNERGGRFVVAVIEGPFCGERERHEADARLIAAAPDLLAALKLAEDILDCASDALEINGDSEATRGLVRSAAIEARAAIAKAEGR